MSLTVTFSMFAQTGSINGRVLDGRGNPVMNVNVNVLNTNFGTSTDTGGEFAFEALPIGQYTIAFSAVGYALKTVNIPVHQGIANLDVALKEEILKLGEVVVQAQKRQQELQKVPLAVSFLNAEQVASLQIQNMTEIGRVSPNLVSLDDGGGFLPLIASRGIATIDNVPVVGVYVDDVPLFNIASFLSSMTDVQSIEVLRGPQGTLYGRNSLAGVINITTRPTGNTTKGFVTAGYGNLNQYELNGVISTPLVKEKLFLRFGANVTGRDGYIENELLGTGDLYAREVYGGNLRLSYIPSTDWYFTLSSNNEYREVTAYAFLMGSGVELDSIKDSNPYRFSLNTEGPYKTFSSNNAFKASYGGKKFNFDAITALQYTATDRENEDLDFTALEARSRTIDVDNFTLSEEIRLSSVGNKRLEWLVGAYAYYVENSNDFRLTQGPDNALFEPDSTIAAQFPFEQITENIVSQKGFSLFGQASYPLTNRLSVLAGLRFEVERSELSADSDFERNGEPYVFPPLSAVPANFEEEATFDAFSPKFGLDYQLSKNVFTYASVAKGYRPGGVNPFVSNQDLVTFGPEFSWNYEVGLKSRFWDQRAKLNLTAFYLEYTDQQLFTVLDINSAAFGRSNAGNSFSFGLEIESEVLIVKGLNAQINLGYLEAEFTDYTVDTFAGQVNFEGNTVPYAPQWNGNLGLVYNGHLPGEWNFNVTVDYQYQEEIFFDPGNTASQEAYGLLNTRFTLSGKQTELALWAKNLTDEIYFGYGFGGAGFPNQVSYGLPRTFGTSLTYRFQK